MRERGRFSDDDDDDDDNFLSSASFFFLLSLFDSFSRSLFFCSDCFRCLFVFFSSLYRRVKRRKRENISP